VLLCAVCVCSYFPDLNELVRRHSSVLKKPYRDPNVPVRFNVSGQIFETRIGTFFRWPRTLLGEMFPGEERHEGKEVFLDRDPLAFAVILNWYRYGKLMIPSSVPLQLIQEEIRYFKLPADISTSPLARTRTHARTHLHSLLRPVRWH
jgi:hypothetical protein